MALEIQVERMRVVEVLRARDAAVERLSDAYSLVRRYSELIERLQEERVASGLERLSLGGSGPAYDTGGSTAVLDTTAHIASLEATIKDLREINRYLREYDACEGKTLCDPPPNYEENIVKASFLFIGLRLHTD